MESNLFNSHEEQHVTSSQQPAAPLPHYTCDVKKASRLFADHGFRVAPRTISTYCRSNLLDCEKFVNGNVTKWKITRDSIDGRIETLKREGVTPASDSELEPADLPAGNSQLQQAGSLGPLENMVDLLREELKEKNKQISEFHAIIHAQNRQFENLNETIQLSNQTIQQLNKTLALPQLNSYLKSLNESGNEDRSFQAEFRREQQTENKNLSSEDN